MVIPSYTFRNPRPISKLSTRMMLEYRFSLSSKFSRKQFQFFKTVKQYIGWVGRCESLHKFATSKREKYHKSDFRKTDTKQIRDTTQFQQIKLKASELIEKYLHYKEYPFWVLVSSRLHLRIMKSLTKVRNLLILRKKVSFKIKQHDPLRCTLKMWSRMQSVRNR